MVYAVGGLLIVSWYFLLTAADIASWWAVLNCVFLGMGFAGGCLGCYYRGRSSVWRELADKETRRRMGNGGFPFGH